MDAYLVELGSSGTCLLEWVITISLYSWHSKQYYDCIS